MNTSTDFSPAPDSFKWLLGQAKQGFTYSDTGASDALLELLEQVASTEGAEQDAAVTACRAQYRAELARAKAVSSPV